MAAPPYEEVAARSWPYLVAFSRPSTVGGNVKYLNEPNVKLYYVKAEQAMEDNTFVTPLGLEDIGLTI